MVIGVPAHDTVTTFCCPIGWANFISIDDGDAVTVEFAAGVELSIEFAAAAGEAPSNQANSTAASAPTTIRTTTIRRPRRVVPAAGTRAWEGGLIGCMFGRRDVSPEYHPPDGHSLAVPPVPAPPVQRGQGPGPRRPGAAQRRDQPAGGPRLPVLRATRHGQDHLRPDPRQGAQLRAAGRRRAVLRVRF